MALHSAGQRQQLLRSTRIMAAAAQRVDSFLADLYQEQQQHHHQEQQQQHQHTEVDIATSPSSALCRTAKLVLDELGIAYRELEVGRDISEAQLVRRKGGPFALLPLVFVDDRFVGGYAELKALATGGADAVLSAGRTGTTSTPGVRGSPSPARAASPPIFDRLHYEAETNEARRAALQRHGLVHGLHSPMSPEREPAARRSSSPPLHPAVRPSLNSPGRELVSQERSGAGIRAVIITERVGMRHDSPHRAVRRGGGWDLSAATSTASDSRQQHRRSRSPMYRRSSKRHTPDRTPAAAALASARAAPALPGPETQRHEQEQQEQVRLQRRIAAVETRLAQLNSGCRLGLDGTSSSGGLQQDEVPLLGVDGGVIISVPSQSAGGSSGGGGRQGLQSRNHQGQQRLHLLLRLLEGACDRVEQQEQAQQENGQGQQDGDTASSAR